MCGKGLIWIDILTPKQFWFFTSLEEELRRKSYDVLLTARRYEQLTPLLEYSGREDVTVIGYYGGDSLAGKLEASLKRSLDLLRIIENKTPTLVFSSGSPEATRIAYGLKIPHILTSDTPESPVNKLTAPLSSFIFTPWVIGSRQWILNGADRKAVKFYRGLDPLAWLEKSLKIEDIHAKYSLEEGRYILVRSPEFKAAYLGIGYMNEYVRMLKLLKQNTGEYDLVVLSRYSDESEIIRREVDGIMVVDKPTYGSALIAGAALFIGGGGTMTQEAALLGIPTLSVYPKPLPTVLKYLARQKLITKANTVEALVKLATRYLENLSRLKKQQKRLAEKVKRRLENPVKAIVERLEEIGIIA